MKSVSVRLKKKHPVLRALGIVLAIFLAVVLVLEIGVFAHHLYKDTYYPDYEKEDISFVLTKESFTDQDYAIIFKQTGLTRAGVDALVFAGKKDDVLKIQEDYFARYEVKKIQFSPLTCCHENYEDIETVPLQNGDVFISPTSHFSFFPLGHSAIVANAAENKIINSTGYNNRSCYEDVSAMTVDPAFIVLRPKLSHFEKTQVVECAKNELFDLPYSISVGVLYPKFSEKPLATNCSHLIWSAFKKAGLDVDSNGGKVVMPMDIALSERFEILQIRGIDPKSIGL